MLTLPTVGAAAAAAQVNKPRDYQQASSSQSEVGRHPAAVLLTGAELPGKNAGKVRRSRPVPLASQELTFVMKHVMSPQR